MRFSSQIIMYGRLYYELPVGLDYYQDGGWVCVDLRTGEEIWRGAMGIDPSHMTDANNAHTNLPSSGMPDISFGYYYDWETMNQHGIYPGLLFAVNGTNWYSVYADTGVYGWLNLTNVPSGTEVIGPQGEILRYVMQNAGTTANPNWRLLQWNSSKVFPLSVPGSGMYKNETGTFNAGLPSAYDWNISLPIANTLTGSITMRAAIYNDVLLCSNGTVSSADRDVYFNTETSTFWAVSLKPESRGQTLFGPTNYQMTMSDGTWNDFVSAGQGIFLMVNLPSYTWTGYSMYTGQQLWESNPESELNPMAYYSRYYYTQTTTIAYGKLFTTGYTGHVLCYDLYNGTLLWTYAAPTHAEIIDYYTLIKGVVADGKLYIGAYEHSPNTPLFKGGRMRCLNATTGEEIWSMLGWAAYTQTVEADGVLVYCNSYDSQLYAVGKGPSQLTVEAPMAGVTQGSGIVIRGAVTDISAGTKQKEQAARFPAGVPAVSDESMSDWMEYVYMQKPKPTNVTGVNVQLTITDETGKSYGAAAVSDDQGNFATSWYPPTPGLYKVKATFPGSESYWPSSAETSFVTDKAPAAVPAATSAAPTVAPTPTPTAPVSPSPSQPLPPPTAGPSVETYIAIAAVAVIVIVAAIALILRRRK